MSEPQTKVNTKVDKAQQTEQRVHGQHKSSPQHKCRFCGAEIDVQVEFCPCCGKKLVDYCTYCGASMSPSDIVCEECGMPAEGVKCPQCGTLNVRSFCRKCNNPLTKAAIRAIEKAKKDPKVQKVAALMDRVAELEALLRNDESNPTEGEQRLQEILSGKVEVAQVVNQNEVREEYERVVKDINQLFEEMLPPVGSTPQEQYNYFSARKVAVDTIRTVKMPVKIGWVCNFCGCFHEKPSDCCEPWRGGKWIYENVEKEVVVKEYKYEE